MMGVWLLANSMKTPFECFQPGSPTNKPLAAFIEASSAQLQYHCNYSRTGLLACNICNWEVYMRLLFPSSDDGIPNFNDEGYNDMLIGVSAN
jgi:hypothetical protein